MVNGRNTKKVAKLSCHRGFTYFPVNSKLEENQGGKDDRATQSTKTTIVLDLEEVG